MPALNKFSAKNLDSSLKKLAADYLLMHMIVKDDYNIVVMPKFVKWYRKDFIKGLKDRLSEKEKLESN